jgi:hypothetical protein
MRRVKQNDSASRGGGAASQALRWFAQQRQADGACDGKWRKMLIGWGL